MNKLQIKKQLRRIIQNAGFDLVRIRKAQNFFYESDANFISLHRKAIEVTESPHDPAIIPERLYNTVQFFIHTLPLEGEIVECGCFKGRSSYLFCSYARQILGEFTGKNYHIFDSFEGISEPTTNDKIDSSEFGEVGQAFLDAGSFQASFDHVKNALKDFPDIKYHPGWIPNTFQNIPEKSYKFVHLDLDLYDPIRASINYFYPRLVPGGVIVIDEYGFPRWPGAKKAVDEFCSQNNLKPISLTTGNGILLKNCSPNIVVN